MRRVILQLVYAQETCKHKRKQRGDQRHEVAAPEPVDVRCHYGAGNAFALGLVYVLDIRDSVRDDLRGYCQFSKEMPTNAALVVVSVITLFRRSASRCKPMRRLSSVALRPA